MLALVRPYLLLLLLCPMLVAKSEPASEANLVRNQLSEYELYPAQSGKFRAGDLISDGQDRCDWLSACICRDESIYTNGTYKLMVNCTQSGLHDVPRHIPNTSTVLTLDGNLIREIEPRAFNNLSILKYLDLSDNDIHMLEEGVFDGLEYLQTLELSGNKIRYVTSSLPENVFGKLPHLARLNLHQNLKGIGTEETFPTKAISQLKQLKHLLIDGLQPQNINETISFVPTLKSLELSSNCGRCNLQTITIGMLKGLRYITDLEISNCSLESVEKGSFAELKNLRNLDMSYNERLHFKNLANITYGLLSIKMKSLKLIKIYETFGDCVKLEAGHLKYLEHMTVDELYLDDNRLTYVNENAVPLIPRNIQKLSLTNNMLLAGDYLHEIFVRSIFDNLKYLTLADQNMNYDALRYFNNKTRQMRAELEMKQSGNFTYVNNQTFCSNCFEQGQAYEIVLYLPTELKDLDFSGLRIRNELKNICICEPNSLIRINLDSNIFWNWQGPIAGLSGLYRLSLAWNSCDNISLDVFEQMPSLIELNLTRNFIESFLRNDIHGRLFQNQKKLLYLLLADNKIRYLPPKLFQGLSSLKGLDLSYNFLTQVDLEFAPSSVIQYLDLSSNLLDKLGAKIMQKFDQEIKSKTKFDHYYIDLTNNKLTCKCNDTDFISWISRTEVVFINFEDYTCKYKGGGSMNLLSAADIYQDLLKDCADYSIVILCTCLAFILFLVIIIIGLTYRYRWDLRYFYYSIKLRMKGNRQLVNQEDEIVYNYDAFISYASESARFVKDDVIPQLEDERDLRLLVHDRDFRAGEFVNDNIMQAITSSRKTLILMSKSFLRSDWCIFEMNMARMEAIKTGRNVVCLIMLEEVSVAGLPLEIMDIIRQQTYIELPAEELHMNVFWDRVHDALVN